MASSFPEARNHPLLLHQHHVTIQFFTSMLPPSELVLIWESRSAHQWRPAFPVARPSPAPLVALLTIRHLTMHDFHARPPPCRGSSHGYGVSCAHTCRSALDATKVRAKPQRSPHASLPTTIYANCPLHAPPLQPRHTVQAKQQAQDQHNKETFGRTSRRRESTTPIAMTTVAYSLKRGWLLCLGLSLHQPLTAVSTAHSSISLCVQLAGRY